MRTLQLATRIKKTMTAERARDAVPVAPLPTTVGLHGNVSVFDPAQEEWGEYTERLVYYFTANEITSQTKQKQIKKIKQKTTKKINKEAESNPTKRGRTVDVTTVSVENSSVTSASYGPNFRADCRASEETI